MGIPGQRQRPLTSGLLITVERSDYTSDGTLTAVAYRNGGAGDNRVLVTNLHVMAGKDTIGSGKDAKLRLRNPRGNEEMYQGSRAAANKVGSPIVDHEPFDLDSDGTNSADIALLALADTDLKTRSAMHNAGAHTYKKIVQGTEDPYSGMPVKLVCGTSTELNGTITKLNRKISPHGTNFERLMEITLNRDEPGTFQGGDSGSPVLHRIPSGAYKMVGIYFARNSNNHKIGYAFRASLAQSV